MGSFSWEAPGRCIASRLQSEEPQPAEEQNEGDQLLWFLQDHPAFSTVSSISQQTHLRVQKVPLLSNGYGSLRGKDKIRTVAPKRGAESKTISNDKWICTYL